jgi:hypothetical protein
LCGIGISWANIGVRGDTRLGLKARLLKETIAVVSMFITICTVNFQKGDFMRDGRNLWGDNLPFLWDRNGF